MGTLQRRAREKDAKRRAILRAAVRCFAKHGYDATTLDAVGRTAEVAKGTLYLYFKSKADLFASLLLEQGFDIFLAALEDALKPCRDFPSALRAFSRTFCALCLEGKKEIFEFFIQLDRGDISRDLSPDLRREARQRLEPILSRLVGFSAHPEARPIAMAFWALCIGVAHMAKGGALSELGLEPRAILEDGTNRLLRGRTSKL